MTTHFLVDGPSISGPRCACGDSWPCEIRDKALYEGGIALGPEAGLSSQQSYIGLTTANPEDKQPYKYMIGQRAIYQDVIVTVCATPEYYGDQCLGSNAGKRVVSETDEIWIDNPEREYKHYVDIKNLKPLPNGQL